MPSQSDVDDAERTGHERGQREMLQQLRTFTGVRDLTPAHDQPEHLAYYDYEDTLRSEIIQTRHVIQVNESRLERSHAEREDLAAGLQSELHSRKQERATRGWVQKVIGAAGDGLHPLRARIRDIDRACSHWQKLLKRARTAESELQTELDQVSEWLDALERIIPEHAARRAEKATVRAADAERALRDITPRGCTVFTAGDFIAQDPRRNGFTTNFLSFGSTYRRDGDDTFEDRGRWSLAWIPATNETVLYITDGALWLLGTTLRTADDAEDAFAEVRSRQSERNSIALVLDAYEQKAAHIR